MTSEPQPPTGERPSSAEDAYARLLALRESGSAPDFETWVRAFPEFERELRALDGSWEHVERSLERVLGSTVFVSPRLLAPSLQRGTHVGEFVLERLIGAGGMGVVWLARQTSLGREVALKFVRPDRETIQSPQLFAREARAASRANDPRIVTVHAVGESDGLRWLAMEHVAGRRSLATWLGSLRESGVPAGHARRAAAFVADVAEALHAAHELGVVHRDVKPQNVLIAPDGTPKLTDFGLARLLDEEALSETLTIRGTVEYMSPEQVTGDTHGIDRRSDVFSLGVLLYELLTLERPFTGVTPIEVITRIAAREPRRPSEVAPGLAPELDVIVAKALEKRPGDRYPSALELARDLRRWLAHEPIAARAPSPWVRLVKWTRRHPVRAVASAATALLLVLLGVSALMIRQQNVELRHQLGRQYVLQALWDIDSGRVDVAAEQVAAFYRLGTEDPEAHLVMAMGYARYLRFAEAQAELELAMELGFVPELSPDP
ncbi:MAG TPA: serine/threonine-protein kinase, partial [Planctomycetota bacterium]|nr:serine/threonine-protein kinase [Planctomycetota bacterium]